MNTPHTLGHIGWSPDYQSAPKLPEIGELQPDDRRHLVRLAGIVGRWVACVDEMPGDKLTVIVWFDGDATLAYHDSEILEKRKGDTGWIMAGSSRVLHNVTHWCREVLPPNVDVRRDEMIRMTPIEGFPDHIEETWRAGAGWQRTDEAEAKLEELLDAIRNLRDVSGRHHSQIACERLFALLPENDQANPTR